MDIRDYFKPGGHKPVDQSLVERTISVLSTALEMVNRGFYENRITSNSLTLKENDIKGEAKGNDIEEGATAATVDIVLKGGDDRLLSQNRTTDKEEDEEWQLSSSVVGDMVRVKQKGDVVSGPLNMTPGLDHFLGPLRADQESECGVSVLKRLRDELGNKEDHCFFCSAATRSRYLLDQHSTYSP